ncbi:MAG: pseudouridine synthase [Gammaproteobacteria bacterium]|jgi:23S rRNA pseudouridine2457 synthase
MIIIFNKPFNTLCQFTGESPNLSDYIPVKGVYAAGRLDKDSEGLLMLTDDGVLQHKISEPKYKKLKTYWVQVEGRPDENAIGRLQSGVKLKDGVTRPAKVKIIDEPQGLWPRKPPVRYRAKIPTTWLELSISEGKNRQIRRMTAAVGHPTLRLIRYSVAEWSLDENGHRLQPGEWRKIEAPEQFNKNYEQHRKQGSHNSRRDHRKAGKVSSRRRT